MREPNIELPTHVQWLFAGHSSSNLDEISSLFPVSSGCLEIDSSLQDEDINKSVHNKSAVAFCISAKTGVSKEMIHFWSYISERQFPRIIIVSGLEFSESDFDDIVLIANRVLEPVVTPYLVLHDEIGEPSGLISVIDGMVHDYSIKPRKDYLADIELQDLTRDFKNEYIEATEEIAVDAFEAGLLVPAIPLVPSKLIGIEEIEQLISRVR